MNEFCAERGTDPECYLGVTPEIIAQAGAVTDALFARFAARRPTDNDRDQVFLALKESRVDPETGEWSVSLPEERKQLLMYAFETAANAGKSGDWRYISGVLERLWQRGIRTLEQAEDYDAGRA